MTHENHYAGGWTWADAHPLTRCVIAAFGGRIGGGTQPALSQEAFVWSVNEALPAVKSDELEHKLQQRNLAAVRTMIIKGIESLSVADAATELHIMIGDFEKLAGPDEYVRDHCQQVKEGFHNSAGERARPHLKALSEAALDHIARPL